MKTAIITIISLSLFSAPSFSESKSHIEACQELKNKIRYYNKLRSSDDVVYKGNIIQARSSATQKYNQYQCSVFRTHLK